eukprot:CAMPEP_0196734394 /NCGR_PEP_ID=MMETSP1091-20130531/13145_1 /TAXON_ID=302021 /ORGANISM="Rhodomonas sp., Strain CCMP768" /LENGTH=505 /DNA_ID=CAMNT_0042077899 /DNA_START=136 /DNA_END=1653 /DNA_ORIENTATION=-
MNEKKEEDKNKHRIYTRRKAGHTSHGRTPKLPVELDLETISQYFSMSQQKACEELGLGLSTLKRLCRKLGIAAWPRQGTEKRALQNVSAEGAMPGDNAGSNIKRTEETPSLLEIPHGTENQHSEQEISLHSDTWLSSAQSHWGQMSEQRPSGSHPSKGWLPPTPSCPSHDVGHQQGQSTSTEPTQHTAGHAAPFVWQDIEGPSIDLGLVNSIQPDCAETFVQGQTPARTRSSQSNQPLSFATPEQQDPFTPMAVMWTADDFGGHHLPRTRSSADEWQAPWENVGCANLKPRTNVSPHHTVPFEAPDVTIDFIPTFPDVSADFNCGLAQTPSNRPRRVSLRLMHLEPATPTPAVELASPQASSGPQLWGHPGVGEQGNGVHVHVDFPDPFSRSASSFGLNLNTGEGRWEGRAGSSSGSAPARTGGSWPLTRSRSKNLLSIEVPAFGCEESQPFEAFGDGDGCGGVPSVAVGSTRRGLRRGSSFYAADDLLRSPRERASGGRGGLGA